MVISLPLTAADIAWWDIFIIDWHWNHGKVLLEWDELALYSEDKSHALVRCLASRSGFSRVVPVSPPPANQNI
jgi:hypothetical protein